MSAQLRQALSTHFGHDAFLEGQDTVIARIVDGDDLCVVMPTGAGKSLCYQLPAMVRPGYTLVISPLISLMKDQVDALRARNIPAEFVNSTLNQSEQQRVLATVEAGQTKLLYVAPERFRSHAFRQLLRNTPPDLLVVDEAHCISQWGHDFRPDYARIGRYVDDLNLPQICAFTATATPAVRDDIVRQLHRPMDAFVTGFTRPNLAFSVVRCSTNSDKLDAIASILADPQPTIIYAATRKHVEQVAERFGAISYHAGMADPDRSAAQERFMSEDVPVVAATNAFGMGIDRPDVRRVIHFNIPGSLEAYYQEAGRAGRDGEDARCILLFAYQDRHIHEFFLEMNNPPRAVVLQTYDALRRLAVERGNNHLEITHAELTDYVQGCKGDQQIGACLKLLEKSGSVARGFRSQNQGWLRVIRTFGELRQRYPEANSQRAIFVHRVCNHYSDWLREGVDCTYDDLTAITRLSREQVTRVLRTLVNVDFDWVPPFAGRGVTVLDSTRSTPEIDFDEQQRYTDLERTRLDDMFNYARAGMCRQQFIISYFGQDAQSWQCQTCDRCVPQRTSEQRMPSEWENALIRTVLDGIATLRGRFGRQRVAQFLTGSRSQAILDGGLHHVPGYGALRDRGQPAVLDIIAACIDAGCVQTVGDHKYPRVQITELGEQVMRQETVVPMEFRQAAGSTRQTRTRVTGNDRSEPGDLNHGNAGSDDLYERLQRLRNELAQRRRSPAYTILNNATLKALAERTPLTVDEAQGIRGIGPKKSRTILPKFIAEIAAWRQETGA